MQQLVVIFIVSLCTAWLAWQAFKFLRPRRGKAGAGCGAGCCDGTEKPAATPGPRTVMIRSDDLRARIAARK